MNFLKKLMLGAAAMGFIGVGGASTQNSSLFLQGTGFVALLVGFVVLYVFAKMAWRAMGCLPALLILGGIVGFVLWSIGGFSNGIKGLEGRLKAFVGKSPAVVQEPQMPPKKKNKEISYNLPPISAPPPQDLDEPDGYLASPSAAEAPAPKIDLSAYPLVSGRARVLSGSAIKVDNRVTVRLYGVDAPELRQRCSDKRGRSYLCGEKAAAWLRGWLSDYPVDCRLMQTLADSKAWGVCALGEYDIGAALANAGWALAYTRQSGIYLPYQEQARKNGRGVWQGDFYTPWDWRELQNDSAKISVTKLGGNKSLW